MSLRPCTRISCNEEAVATLTYSYADSMAVLGPLSGSHEPHSYDLCDRHARRTSAPQGWQIVKHRIVTMEESERGVSTETEQGATPQS